MSKRTKPKRRQAAREAVPVGGAGRPGRRIPPSSWTLGESPRADTAAAIAETYTCDPHPDEPFDADCCTAGQRESLARAIRRALEARDSEIRRERDNEVTELKKKIKELEEECKRIMYPRDSIDM